MLTFAVPTNTNGVNNESLTTIDVEMQKEFFGFVL